MIEVDCFLCGCKDKLILFHCEDIEWKVPGEFYMAKCLGCGLVYVTPQPQESEIGKFYPKAYYFRLAGEALPESYIRRLNKKLASRTALIKRFKKEGKLLEIGCGDGSFLNFIKDKGFDVYGLDFSQDAASQAKDKIGSDRVFCGRIKDAAYPVENFDVICLFEVLEHFNNPFEILSEVKKLLKKDGVLIATVPNFGCLERNLLGRCWYGVDVPRHLHHFTDKSLKSLITKADFKIIFLKSVMSHKINEIGPTQPYSDGLRVWLRAVGFYPERQLNSDLKSVKAVKKKVNILKEVIHFCESVVFYPLLLAGFLLGKNGTLVVAAKRKE